MERKIHDRVIRPAVASDGATLWQILEPTIRAGETFALPRGMSQQNALAYWMNFDHETFVLEESGRILGTYFLKPNQLGGGAHVANGGYATAREARGRGIARSMCLHSLNLARARGFKAMQFNFVVSTNEVAVRLWKILGFGIVGTLPGAFAHPQKGDVDVFVMFQKLTKSN